MKTAVGYGFHSNGPQELARVMLGCCHQKTNAEWLKLSRHINSLTRSMVSLLDRCCTSRCGVDKICVGKACFACEIEGEEDVLTNNSCPCCHMTFETAPKLLAHISAHILHDPSISQEDEPCGLCLTSAPACQIALRKYKNSFTVNYTNSTCQRLVKFSYVAAN